MMISTAKNPGTTVQTNMGMLIVRLMRDLDGYNIRIKPFENKHYIKVLVGDEKHKAVEVWVKAKSLRLCTENAPDDTFTYHKDWSLLFYDKVFELDAYPELVKALEKAITTR